MGDAPHVSSLSLRFAVGLLAVNGVCLAALCSWLFVYHYYMRAVDVIRRRHPDLTVAMGISAVLFLGIHMTLVSLWTSFPCCIQLRDSSSHSGSWRVVLRVLSHSLMGVNVTCCVVRAHLMWFDIKWCQSMEENEWKLSLNQDTTDAFIKYRDSLGSKSLMLCIYATLVLVFAVADIALLSDTPSDITFSPLSRAFGAMVGVCAIVHLTLICSTLPVYDDFYHMREEVRLFAAVMIFFFALYTAFSLAFDPKPPTVIYSVFLLVASLPTFATSVVAIPYILHRCKLPISIWHWYKLEKGKLLWYKPNPKEAAKSEREPSNSSTNVSRNPGFSLLQKVTMELWQSSRKSESSKTESKSAVSNVSSALGDSKLADDKLLRREFQKHSRTPSMGKDASGMESTTAAFTLAKTSGSGIAGIGRLNLTLATESALDAASDGLQIVDFQLSDVLATEEGFRLFARHVTREFSAENILFLIETEQFADKLHSDWTRLAKRKRRADDKQRAEEKQRRQRRTFHQMSGTLSTAIISAALRRGSAQDVEDSSDDVEEEEKAVVHVEDAEEDVKIESEEDTSCGTVEEMDEVISSAEDSCTVELVDMGAIVKRSSKLLDPSSIASALEQSKEKEEEKTQKIDTKVRTLSLAVPMLLQYSQSIVPKSTIVYDPDLDEYQQAIAIFEKYVPQKAEYCVNLSGRCRMQLFERFNYVRGKGYVRKDELGDILSRVKDGSKLLRQTCRPRAIPVIFNKAQKEIRMLLSDSYLRFKDTAHFTHWVQKYGGPLVGTELSTPLFAIEECGMV